MNETGYRFLRDAARILNSGQTRSLVLTGPITDLFHTGAREGGDYVPLPDFLVHQWTVKGTLVVVYEPNGSIRFLDPDGLKAMREAWGGVHGESEQHAIDLALAPTRRRLEELRRRPVHALDDCLRRAQGNPTYALEVLRQMCLCSRSSREGEPLLWDDLLIVIEGADFLIPEGDVGRMGDADRQRVVLCRDWFSDPDFVNGRDRVILLAESLSLLHSKVVGLPQVMSVDVDAPDRDRRLHVIEWFLATRAPEDRPPFSDSPEALAQQTAGLSIHAMLQLLRHASHTREPLAPSHVIARVESHIQRQLGGDVVEFKKPSHTMADVVGFRRLKEFLRREFIPRIRSTGKSALPGAVIGGPIGSGKSFILEAVAGELGIPVLVLKNIRSKWFGETDLLFERLRRIIQTLDKSLIFVDEADTQFGGVGAGAHETERRLTGKVQAMMSDPALRGRTSWLLITARLQALSPDIRRPGRAGSLIIPILDPEGEDFDDFVQWMIRPVFRPPMHENGTDAGMDADAAPSATGDAIPVSAGTPLDMSGESASDADTLLREATQGYYAASFAEVRSDLIAAAELAGKEHLSMEDIRDILADHIPPDVAATRRYQTLQALLNCTRRSLLPESGTRESAEAMRTEWRREIQLLEAEGIS